MEYIEITPEIVKQLLPMRYKDSNKGSYGKVLNIAGCFNYQGAAYLSSIAPLKVGAGLVTLATISQVINNLASTSPWITFLPLRDYNEECISANAFASLAEKINGYDIISIGSGLSCTTETKTFVSDALEYLSNSEKKAIIDADAINAIAKIGIKTLPQNCVITPHPMELSRLISVSVEEIQSNRIEYAQFTAQKHKTNIILKGNETVICTKDMEVFINTTGNSALAKAGSGDVLTGMIAGFMAQGLSIKDASIVSVYLHGLSGELASKDLTEYCVLATDLIDYIPKAINRIIGG